MLNRHRKLRMEQMEAREMMAGDVTASVVNGSLYLTEAANQANRDNAVTISQISANHIRVTGNATTTDGTLSKINGAASQDFFVTGGLNIKFAGGSDLVVFDEAAPPSFLTANIDLAAPPLTIGSSQTTPYTNALSKTDNDNLIMWGGAIKGALTVNTGDGADWVFLGNVSVGSATINTGASHDEVELAGAHVLGNLDIQTYGSLSETDADVVYFDTDANYTKPTLIDGSANIRTGGGDDSFFSTDPNTPDTNVFLLGLHTHGSLTIDAGAGNDSAYLRNIRVDGNFSMNMGAGADSMDMRQTPIDGEFGFAPAVSGTMTVQMYSSVTENDIDTVNMLKIGSVGTMNILMGGGNDQLTLTDVTSKKDMTLDAGAGDDTVQLTRVSAYDNFFANLGDGNDQLTIADLYDFFGTTKIDGGNGTDRLTRTGAFPTTHVTQLNFEWINGRPQLGLTVATPVNATTMQA